MPASLGSWVFPIQSRNHINLLFFSLFPPSYLFFSSSLFLLSSYSTLLLLFICVLFFFHTTGSHPGPAARGSRSACVVFHCLFFFLLSSSLYPPSLLLFSFFLPLFSVSFLSLLFIFVHFFPYHRVPSRASIVAILAARGSHVLSPTVFSSFFFLLLYSFFSPPLSFLFPFYLSPLFLVSFSIPQGPTQGQHSSRTDSTRTPPCMCCLPL
jgi:hypothetical protein